MLNVSTSKNDPPVFVLLSPKETCWTKQTKRNIKELMSLHIIILRVLRNTEVSWKMKSAVRQMPIDSSWPQYW